jgi:hypothetical protein
LIQINRRWPFYDRALIRLGLMVSLDACGDGKRSWAVHKSRKRPIFVLAELPLTSLSGTKLPRKLK